jgi:UDP-N-acetylglucosamine:LPS N-acetylglucosamine transferase
MPWGHRALAQAAYGYLKKEEDFEVQLVQIKLDSGLVNYAYGLTTKLMPKVIKYGKKIFEGKTINKLVGEVGALEAGKVKRVVDKVRPDLILSSHFMLTHALTKIRKGGGSFSLLNCVSDPWTVFPAVFSASVDKNLVYDERTIKAGLKAGISGEKMEVIGWLTRPEFFEKRDSLAKIRKKYGLKKGVTTVFVGGGSLGATAYFKLFPALTLAKNKVQVIFNCGTDKTLKTIVEKYAEVLKKKNDGVEIKVFGWVDKMDELLAVSDIVFGKAGPNFLFDVVASGKPFVSVTHVPAQEVGNVEMIRKKRLGWVKEGVGELTSFFIDFLKKPERYTQRFVKNIEKEAEYNRKSGERLVRVVREELLGIQNSSSLRQKAFPGS